MRIMSLLHCLVYYCRLFMVLNCLFIELLTVLFCVDVSVVLEYYDYQGLN